MTNGTNQAALEDALNVQAANIKKGRIEVIVMGIIIVFVSVYLGVINHKLASFTSKELATVVKSEIHNSLPEIKTEIQKQAIAAAPQVISNLKAELLDAPQKVRKFTEEHSSNALSGVLLELEEDIDSLMTESFETAWRSIEAQLPGLSDQERLDLLVDTASMEFREKMNTLLELAFEAYGTEAQTLITNLNKLSNPESKLDSREKIYKELIETWLVLSDRYKLAMSPEGI